MRGHWSRLERARMMLRMSTGGSSRMGSGFGRDIAAGRTLGTEGGEAGWGDEELSGTGDALGGGRRRLMSAAVP